MPVEVLYYFGVDASVCHFLVCNIPHELVGKLEPNLHRYNIEL